MKTLLSILLFLFYFPVLFNVTAQLYIKYPDNPVIDTLNTTNSNEFWTRWKTDPSLIYWVGDSLRVYYGTNNYGFQTQIGTAVSKDGNYWIEKTDSPVLTTGPVGSWDGLDVETPEVIYVPSNPDSIKYLLYYSGSQYDSIVLGTSNSGLYPAEIYQIGLSYSSDGINFIKYNDPINDLNPLYQNSDPVIRIPYTSGGMSDTINYLFSSVAEPSIIYDTSSNKFKIWYIGLGCSNPNCIGAMAPDFRYRILYSESLDGVHWSSPALSLDIGNIGDFDSQLIYAPDVMKIGDEYFMFYGGNTSSSNTFSFFSQKIGLATSIDGINFIKSPNNPIITNGASNMWDHLGVNYPSAIVYKDTLRVYYSGMQDSLLNFNPKIGYFYIDSNLTSIYISRKPKIVVYPNPTLERLLISGLSQLVGIRAIEIKSPKGEVVIRLGGIKEEIDVSMLERGVYFLIIDHDRGTETIQFIK